MGRVVLSLLVTGCVATAAGQRPRFPADSIHIAVDLAGPRTARIRQHIRLSAPVRTADFTYLARACATISAVEIARGPRIAQTASDTATPWVTIHDTTERTENAEATWYEVRYDVVMSGADLAIPVVMPAAALATVGGTAPTVLLEVDLAAASPRARVASPRMAREGNRWTARLAAVPSVISLSDADEAGTPCDAGRRALPGDAGSFWTRFALLLATMALWVPLYFLWAGSFGRRDSGVAMQ